MTVKWSELNQRLFARERYRLSYKNCEKLIDPNQGGANHRRKWCLSILCHFIKGTVSSKKKSMYGADFFLLAFLIFLNQKNIVWGPNSVKNIATTFHFHDSFSWANHHYTSMAASLEACKITTELAQIIHYWRYAYAVVLLIELSLGRGSLRYCL